MNSTKLPLIINYIYIYKIKQINSFINNYFSIRFKLVEEHLIEFNKVAMLNNGGSQEMLNRVTTKDNIGIAALLETTDGIYEGLLLKNISHIRVLIEIK